MNNRYLRNKKKEEEETEIEKFDAVTNANRSLLILNTQTAFAVLLSSTVILLY